jgi:hypothetical protein
MPIKTIIQKSTQYVLKKHNTSRVDETLSSVRPRQLAVPDEAVMQKEAPSGPAIPAELSSPVSTQAQPAAPYVVEQPPAEPKPRAKTGNLMWS